MAKSSSKQIVLVHMPTKQIKKSDITSNKDLINNEKNLINICKQVHGRNYFSQLP